MVVIRIRKERERERARVRERERNAVLHPHANTPNGFDNARTAERGGTFHAEDESL